MDNTSWLSLAADEPKYPECVHINLEACTLATGGRDSAVPLHLNLLQNTEQGSAARVFHISLLLHQMTN